MNDLGQFWVLKSGMIVYIWAVSGKLFLFQQEEHRLLMND